jgi:hypothetical protein
MRKGVVARRGLRRVEQTRGQTGKNQLTRPAVPGEQAKNAKPTFATEVSVRCAAEVSRAMLH